MGGVCSRKNRCLGSNIKPLKRVTPGGKKLMDTKKILATVPQSKQHEFKNFYRKGVNYLTKRGQNILMMYVWYAEPPLLETITYLLKECDINPNQIDNTGWSALHYAASNPFVSLECLELLGDSAGQVSKDG